MADRTALQLRENGYFVTSDSGNLTFDGYLQIVGRANNLIITGGYNIYPKEVEYLLNGMDQIN